MSLTAFKGWLRRRAPRTFGVLRRAAGRVLVEYRVLRHLRLRRLVWPARRRTAWREALPLQAPTRFRIPAGATAGVSALRDQLVASGLAFREGGHSLYLPPATWRASALSELARRYPEDAGLKVLRNSGGVDDGEYLAGSHHSRVQRRLLHGHRHLTLVANLLYQHELGPRMYDLVEISEGNDSRVGYVMQDVAGRKPTEAEWRGGVDGLRALCASGKLGLVAPDGFGHKDFACPDCSGNAWIDRGGRFRFVDFQNFVLGDYDRYLRGVAQAAARDSHFGDTSLLRGGQYLYQSVPGLALPAKRDIAVRMATVERLLQAAGCELEDRVALDVGCNIGMMLGQYLRLGARWGHGWDRASIVPHSERMLLSLGCTRMSFTGGEVNAGRQLDADLPRFVAGQLDGCFISYLAVRKHLGWLSALRTLPWAFLLYEGHEGEDLPATEGFLQEFRGQVPCEVVGLDTYRDGDSRVRALALLRRA